MHQIGCLSNEKSPRQRICCSFRGSKSSASHLWGKQAGEGVAGVSYWQYLRGDKWETNYFWHVTIIFQIRFYLFYSSVRWEEKKGKLKGGSVERWREGGREMGGKGGEGKEGGRRKGKECSVVLLNFWSIFIVLRGLCICLCVNTKWHQLLAYIINQQKFSSQE